MKTTEIHIPFFLVEELEKLDPAKYKYTIAEKKQAYTIINYHYNYDHELFHLGCILALKSQCPTQSKEIKTEPIHQPDVLTEDQGLAQGD